MSKLSSVIDLCSDEEDEMLPSNISNQSWVTPDQEQQAVEKCSSRVSLSTSGIDFASDKNYNATSERYVLNEVDGVKILEFETEVDMEFYANHAGVDSSPDEDFFGFDVKNKPSTVLIDFFEKVKKLKLSSCNAIVPQSTLPATALPPPTPPTALPPPASPTALPGDVNSVEDDEDCVIVQGDRFVPIRPPVCKRCGKCTLQKKKVLPSITEVISLDSDEEEIANTSSNTPPMANRFPVSDQTNNNIYVNKGTTKSSIECPNSGNIKKFFREPKIVDKDNTSIKVPEIGDGITSKRASLKRPCSDRAVPSDESVPSNYSCESIGSTSSCTRSTSQPKRIRHDRVHDTSHVDPVQISSNETDFGSMLSQCDEKDMNSHSVKIHDSQARMSNVLETQKSQTNIMLKEEITDCAIPTQERVSIKTSLTSFAMPTDTDTDDIIYLDSDDDTSYVSLKEASTNTTLHETVLNRGCGKIIESQAKTDCSFSVVPTLINDAPTLLTKIVCNDTELQEVSEVLHDIVDYVCRQEDISNLPLRTEPYIDSHSASNNVQNMPSCLKPYCTMGCICHCLRRKCTRKRCVNTDCIFGCICNSFLKPRRVPKYHRSSAPPTSDVKNGVTSPASTDIFVFGSKSDKNKSTDVCINAEQKPRVIKPQYSRRKQTLAPTKISAVDCIVLEVHPTAYNPSIHPGGTITPSVTKKTGRMVQQSLWKPNSIFKKTKFANDSMNLQQIVGNNMRLSKNRIIARKDSTKMSDQTCLQSQNLPLTDAPLPAFALTCLTPGIGYIALEEFGSSILRLCDPFEPSDCRTFTSVSLATEWLNYNLKVRLKFEPGVELKWLVANSTMIQIKKIKRFDSRVLLDPRCRITKNGVVFI